MPLLSAAIGTQLLRSPSNHNYINMSATEPFPRLSPSSSRDQLMPLSEKAHGKIPTMTKPRRKSSGLGGEIRAGDTGAPSLSTFDYLPQSPTTVRVSTATNTTVSRNPPRPSSHPSSQAQIEKDRKKPFSKRRKAKGLFRRWRNYALKHTWVTPAFLIAVILFLFAVNPTQANPIYHFIFLSYKLPHPPGTEPGTPHQYGKGLWDIAFVFFYIIVLSFTREFIMQTILRPLALKSGLKSRSKQSRFMEQAYTAIYFAFLGPAGMYVMSRTPVWYFNTRGMYEGFPHKTHEGIFKFYYLFQGAYWAQQWIVLMLGMEKPRKDFKELVGHHIVSVALIAMSYRFHFTYMGLAVYITHDISDFFLAVSLTNASSISTQCVC